MAPNTRAASAASREFLQPKVDRIDDLAEAARAIDAAVQARAAADRHITDCQQGVRPHSARGNRGGAGPRTSWTSSVGRPSVGRSRSADAAPRRPGGLPSRPRPRRRNPARLPPARPPLRPRPSRSSGAPGPTRALRRALIPTVPDVTRRAPTRRRRWAPARDRIRLRSNIGSGRADRVRLAGLTGLDRGGRA